MRRRLAAHGAFRPWDVGGDEFKLDVVPAEKYVEFAAKKIAAAIDEAWNNRAPGGVAFGQDYAVVGRNRRWVPQIEECLSQQKCFVVVGAAHLVGPDGLVAMLRAKGYTVKQQ